MTIRIGVLSDTHLHRVTPEFRGIYDQYLSDVDLIFHAGDFTSPALISFLDKQGFHGVHGNMDPMEVKTMLPEKKVVPVGRFRMGLIHGWGSSEGLENRIWDEFHDVDVIVYGHSHKAVNHVREGVLLFNPGTATGYAMAGGHSIGVLECGEDLQGDIIRLD
jgi:putative phosphoesterase